MKDARFAELSATDEERKQLNQPGGEASEKLRKNEDFQTKYNEFMMQSIGKNSEEAKSDEQLKADKSGAELKRNISTIQEEEKEYEPETTEESAFRKTTEISVYG
jgi:hypothetical protein